MVHKSEYKVYLAGELFDAKHLAGNVLLSEAIERESKGRFQVMLPQNLELPSMEPKAIRDQDFVALLDCDAAIFQFDGGDPDSGTVVEFMAAKFADLPSVVLRTDFRRGGDRNEYPWNLMCSFYPRTETVVLDAMGLYAEQRKGECHSGMESVERMMNAVGRTVIENLENCLRQPSLEGIEKSERDKWLRSCLGID